MLKILLNLFLILKLSSCQRRITNGSIVDSTMDTSFLVYIVAAKADDNDPGWLCGGSIIHPSLVLTAGSCLHARAQKMYVIPGYRHYVNNDRLDNDTCTHRMKRRIVSYCVAKNHARPENGWYNENIPDQAAHIWIRNDIGIARIDTPIDFYDNDYLKYCSYRPSSIRTNFNSKYELAGTQVVVFGWGHTVYFRPEGDLTDYNVYDLRYASSVIIPKDVCMSMFTTDFMTYRIKLSFVCAEGRGHFDAHGRDQTIHVPTVKKCAQRRSGGNDTENDGKNKTCFSASNSEETSSYNDTLNVNINATTRRHGFCQNDHGGPLVRWIGGHRYVIGIASTFKVNKQMECMGPYLYTSTSCMSAFIDCIMQEQITHTRRTASKCGGLGANYKMLETVVDWSDEDF